MIRYAHEKMQAYTKGIELVKSVYQLMPKIPDDERYGLKSQMKRASVSFVSNFVEGNSRRSLKEKKRFFECGYGSLMELDSQLIISKDLFSLDSNQIECVREDIQVLVKIISGLRRSIS